MTDDSRLFAALTARTKDGKLHWSATAQEGAFIAAVNGVMVFRLKSMLLGWKYQPCCTKAVLLEAIDEHGDDLFKIISYSASALQTWEFARHNSQRPHEGIDEALLLLESL